METKTIGDFLGVLKTTKNFSARMFMEEWETPASEHYASFAAQPLNSQTVVALRNGFNNSFVARIARVCTDELYADLHKDYVEFIREFDERAAACGFRMVGAKQPVSLAETMVREGYVRIDGGTVSLTPKGVRAAKKLRREL